MTWRQAQVEARKLFGGVGRAYKRGEVYAVGIVTLNPNPGTRHNDYVFLARGAGTDWINAFTVAKANAIAVDSAPTRHQGFSYV